MKKFILSLSLAGLLLGASSCTDKSTSEANNAALIPIPQESVFENQYFTLNQSTIIGAGQNDELKNIAQFLNNKIEPAFGFKLDVKEKGDITFSLIDDETLGNEGYKLKITSGGIEISAYKPAGIFYGVQSVLQMLPKEVKSPSKVDNIKWTVQCGEITDKPQFPWRGIMFDVSRHFFTKEEVMKLIDQMAEYKMNVFHWHLSDDQGWRLEIKSLPKLTEKGAWRAERVGDWWSRQPQQEGEATTYGGYYTQEDVKEVLAYAKERYIRVIPEIDVPGHSLAALVAYPELSCMNAPKTINVGNKFYGEDENTLCIGKESTFEWLDKVFTEVAALFPDEYIHIGGDECFKGFWHKCPRCQARMKAENLKNEEELQSYCIHRLESMLKEKGKKLIGWDEILEGGLAPEATVMSWRGMEGGNEDFSNVFELWREKRRNIA